MSPEARAKPVSRKDPSSMPMHHTDEIASPKASEKGQDIKDAARGGYPEQTTCAARMIRSTIGRTGKLEDFRASVPRTFPT